MYTVALISKECCKTYHYEGFAEAEKEYKYWLGCFKTNNVVDSRTTIIERDCADKIISVKNILKVAHDSDLYFMILSKDRNN